MATVLVVDDNRATADALCSLLTALGVQAVPAYGPRAALEMLDSVKPRLIFLDLNMPGVNGFEVLGFLKREPRLAQVPVVVITSDDQEETRTRAFKSGALGVIVKPASLNALEHALKRAGLL